MVEMGGFKLVDSDEEDKDPDDQSRKVLTFDDLRQLVQDPRFNSQLPPMRIFEIG